MSKVLSSWRSVGMFGNKLAAYAPVHATNTTELQQCIDWFGVAYCGVNLPQPAEGQFKQDGTGVWQLTGTSADQQIEGGHCIVLVAYDADNLYAVTWGAIVGITYQWWAQYADEAWATITQEFVSRGGDAHAVSAWRHSKPISKAPDHSDSLPRVASRAKDSATTDGPRPRELSVMGQARQLHLHVFEASDWSEIPVPHSAAGGQRASQSEVVRGRRSKPIKKSLGGS